MYLKEYGQRGDSIVLDGKKKDEEEESDDLYFYCFYFWE